MLGNASFRSLLPAAWARVLALCTLQRRAPLYVVEYPPCDVVLVCDLTRSNLARSFVPRCLPCAQAGNCQKKFTKNSHWVGGTRTHPNPTPPPPPGTVHL